MHARYCAGPARAMLSLMTTVTHPSNRINPTTLGSHAWLQMGLTLPCWSQNERCSLSQAYVACLALCSALKKQCAAVCSRLLHVQLAMVTGWPALHILAPVHCEISLYSFIGAASDYWSGVHGCAALAVAVAHQGGVWVQLPCCFGPGTGHLLG
jgi:hypothetical protein